MASGRLCRFLTVFSFSLLGALIHQVIISFHPTCLFHRWSVKEASYKAMYPVVKASWKEFTYENFSKKPSLRYDPILDANRHKIGQIHVSVSHDGDYVYSSVLVEGNILSFFGNLLLIEVC